MADEPQDDPPCHICGNDPEAMKFCSAWHPEMHPESEEDPLGWWSIRGSELLAALKRCAQGENPDIVYAELYANSESEIVEDEPPEI